MTYKGAVYLMRQAFNDVEMLQFDIQRATREIDTYIPEYNWGDDIDVILLAGSPWIGGTIDNLKVEWLKQAKKRWGKATKIAIGIGSFIRQAHMIHKTYHHCTVEFIRDFDLIAVRDMIAQEILDYHGVKSVLSYDTALHYPYKARKSRRKRSILLYYDPFVNDVWDQLSKDVWNKYIFYQLDWAIMHNAEIIVITSGDKASLMEKQVDGRFVTDLEWLANRFAQAQQVLSGRVHQAILASIMGCKNVSLLPVDSRYTTVFGTDISIVQPVEGLFPVWKGLKLHKKRKDIVKLLEGVISEI